MYTKPFSIRGGLIFSTFYERTKRHTNATLGSQVWTLVGPQGGQLKGKEPVLGFESDASSIHAGQAVRCARVCRMPTKGVLGLRRP